MQFTHFNCPCSTLLFASHCHCDEASGTSLMTLHDTAFHIMAVFFRPYT